MRLDRCPFCGEYASIVEDPPTFFSVECGNCGARTALSYEETAIELWNRRTAVTDQQFAWAVHDGRTWVCVEGALESDAMKPIPGFTRDSLYRDSMQEYVEWMEKAKALMRDIWEVADDMFWGGTDSMSVKTMTDLEDRLGEFGIGESPRESGGENGR